jgi:hypothetical protein
MFIYHTLSSFSLPCFSILFIQLTSAPYSGGEGKIEAKKMKGIIRLKKGSKKRRNRCADI